MIRLPYIGMLGLLALFLATSAQAAFWYESYDEAERALAEQNWQRAVDMLENALEKRGESCVGCRTYGVNFIDYLPYFQLGIAHYQLGNHEAALTAFDREEQLGAIADSTDALAELGRYRQLARQALDVATAEERDRVVAQSLESARTLESAGELTEALVEVNRALTHDPENPTASEALTRIQTALDRRRNEAERAQRFSDLVRRGQQLLEDGEFGEAVATLKQATGLQQDPQTQGLLERAESGLAEQLASQRDERERATTIADALNLARSLETGGDFSGALAALQPVLALDAQNAEARMLQNRLIDSQNRSDSARRQAASIDRLLSEADVALSAGDLDAALASTSQALSIDPTANNRRAYEMMRQVQTALRRGLLDSIGGGTLPPLIAFFEDRRQETEDDGGPAVEMLDTPDFQLVGSVYSGSPAIRLEGRRHDAEPEADAGEQIDVVVREPIGLDNGQYLINFSVGDRAPDGFSEYKIAATDEEDRRVTRSYAVRYDLPFFRTTPFYVALATAILGGVGAGYAVSSLRRRRKLKRKFNPYIAGAPVVSPDTYFGRELLMGRVLQTVHNNSILLFGERRIGKTSFQHRLKRRLKELNDPDYDFHPVFIDLQGTPQERFFATLAEDVFEELAPVLDDVHPNPALHDGSDYAYKELIRDMRNVLQALKRRNTKRVKLVLLIDEVDELNSYDPRINQRLRSLFMKSFAEDLVAVVSGVGIKKHWESEGSPWYNFFEEIEVKPFRREDAVELIERPIQGVFKLEGGVTEHIIDVTECRPYLIQKMCVSLVNRLHEDNRRLITLADAEAIGRPEEA